MPYLMSPMSRVESQREDAHFDGRRPAHRTHPHGQREHPTTHLHVALKLPGEQSPVAVFQAPLALAHVAVVLAVVDGSVGLDGGTQAVAHVVLPRTIVLGAVALVHVDAFAVLLGMGWGGVGWGGVDRKMVRNATGNMQQPQQQ